MSPRILLHLLLITISLEVIAQDAQQIFYDSFLFCKYLDQLPENERANYSDQLLSEFPNDKFVEMDKNENLLFNDPAKEIDFDYSDSLQAFFHILTGYKYFDDSKYDQFEKRRLEQFQSTHNVVKAVTDQSIFKIVDEVKGSSLGLFDFDRSCFTLDISSSTDTYSKLNNHSDQKEKPNNYESNSYKLELAPINNPDLIRIVIDDEDKAQQFSHSTMKVSYIFTLTGHVEEYKSFQDIASTGMNYYEAQIYRLGSIGGDWAQWNAWQRLNTQKRIKIFNKYCQTNGMPGLPPYGRRYYHRMETQLMAVILESKIIGNYFWKAPKWSKVIANEKFLKSERLKREELLRAELKAERLKKEELLRAELKAERLKKEELFKAELKAGRRKKLEPLTDIDGNKYRTIKIGDQIWMAENLKVTHYRNGDKIATRHSNRKWKKLSSGGYAYYDNKQSNIETYGLLYNWYAINDNHKIAPKGWHLPTDDEWKELEMYLGMNQYEADERFKRGGNVCSILAGNAGLWVDGPLINDSEFGSSGFNALPGGERSYDGSVWTGMGTTGDFWSATEYNSLTAWCRSLHYYDSGVDRRSLNKRYGLSVRLVKD